MSEKSICIDLTDQYTSNRSILIIVELDGCTSQTYYYDFNEWLEALSRAEFLLQSGEIRGFYTRETTEKFFYYTKEKYQNEI